jgi:hypothetical protein|tara:strand:+ start:188 stop:1006 length:819 start_codon:yes stop_codon:yes gene_type:complete
MTTLTKQSIQKDSRSKRFSFKKKEKSAVNNTVAYERALIVANPHTYFTLMPRDILLAEFGSRCRYLPNPKGTKAVRVLFSLLVGAVTWILAFMLFSISFALLFKATYQLAIGPSLILCLVAMSLAFKKYWRAMIPYFDFMQPLWLLIRVTDEYHYEPIYEHDVSEDDEDMTEGRVIDLRSFVTPLEKPRLIPYVPKSLLEEVMTTTKKPVDKGIIRARIFFFSLNPIDFIDWFRRAKQGLGKADAVVGAGFILATLIAVFLFVQAQTPTTGV